MSESAEYHFNILDWSFFHEMDDEDVERYVIRLFGRTDDDRTIYVRVDGYTPYFFVEIPPYWNEEHHAKIFVGALNEQVDSDYRSGLLKYDIVEKHKFRGFTNYKKFKFLRMIFAGLDSMRAYSRVLGRRQRIPGLGHAAKRYQLYESNIEPMLRCMHIQDLQATGWVRVNRYTELDDDTTCCDINIQTHWKKLIKSEESTIAGFKIASYDLECTSEDGSFPQAERAGDKIIQIGTTFSRYGEQDCYRKHIITLGSCDPIEGVDVESYETEAEVLMAWCRLMKEENPDIITGYNIFGFDERYLYGRSIKLGCHAEFSFLGRLNDEHSDFKEKNLSSSALGDNFLYFYERIGRVNIDLMKVVMRDHNLTSYKLDNVASHFIQEKIKSVELVDDGCFKVETGNTFGIEVGGYVVLMLDGVSQDRVKGGKKFPIVGLSRTEIWLRDEEAGELVDELRATKRKILWCQAKDDVSPQDIFRLQKGSSADRAIVAKYCIQDCKLVNILIAKLDIITNNVGMSNVCHVPFSYIFLRGQGVKIFSLVAKKCRKRKHLIPVIYRNRDEEEENQGYEGATVLPPKSGVYFTPVTVLDYASLYPRSMIQKNLSHECYVMNSKYDNLPGVTYFDAEYKVSDDQPMVRCRFARVDNEDGTPRRGIIPEILMDLLDARALTKKKMKQEPDPFKKSILDGLQLAYKITANSLYGQIGAPTSAIYLKEIAASTTATGREMLHLAKEEVENNYPGAEVVYGDTDSIFIKFKILDEDGNERVDREALVQSIQMGKDASDYINSILPDPQELEYEKVFWPFCLISKKRYVGNLYEEDPDKFKQKSMGIVLKRRDNADIVKIVVGGIVDKILNERSAEGAVEFARNSVEKMMNGEFPMEKFVISKTLRAEYKNPQSIAHKVLAERMGERDPGNKPQVNDRIPFVYKEMPGKQRGILQGDRVEHPDYMIDHGLKIDYRFYLTNQIAKPAGQFLNLISDSPNGVFQEALLKDENRRLGRADITNWLTRGSGDPEQEPVINSRSERKIKVPKQEKKKRVVRRKPKPVPKTPGKRKFKLELEI